MGPTCTPGLDPAANRCGAERQGDDGKPAASQRGVTMKGGPPAYPAHTADPRPLATSNLLRSAAGARLIQADGLDGKSPADVAASLADALEELHRLQRSLDRRIRRDRVSLEPAVNACIGTYRLAVHRLAERGLSPRARLPALLSGFPKSGLGWQDASGN